MRYFSRFSPLAAIRDLRAFLAARRPYELWFGILAILVTGTLMVGFILDSRIAAPYRPNIVYIEQWRGDRTDDQIVAQQKVDQVAVDARNAEIERRRLDRQAQFKRLDDKMKAWGL